MEQIVISRIIVAFDGSDLSREAFAHAVMLAEKASSDIEVHAVHLIEPAPPPAMMGEAVTAFDPNPVLAQVEIIDRREQEREKAWAEEEFNALSDYCSRKGVTFTSEIDAGRVNQWLVDHARDTDLIAIGMKGRFARAGIGSLTKWLVKHALCPTLIIGDPVRTFERLVVVFDGSAPSRRAVEWTTSVATELNMPAAIFATCSDQASLGQTREEARSIAPESEIIEYEPVDGNEAEQVEHFVKHAGRNLLVLGAYSDSWIHQLLFGGTTAHVVSHVNSPVVLVP